MKLANYIIFISSVLMFAHASAAEKMIALSDYELHTTVQGDGDNIVLFEAGFGSDSTGWSDVIELLGSDYTAVAYSRAGLGKSGSDGKAKTIDEHLEDLASVVEALGNGQKIVLAGHSYGGILVTEFMLAHPALVKGVVLVDPSTLTQRLAFKAVAEASVLADDTKLLAYMPPELVDQYRLLIEQMDNAEADSGNFQSDIPIAILTSTKVFDEPFTFEETEQGKQIWQQLHSQLFARFSNGMHIKTATAGHSIQTEEPGLIVQAILYVSQ
ncbi:MAG: alpha/beta hydrolase [Pseudohongiella sp.]